jgi:hypothetical protein
VSVEPANGGAVNATSYDSLRRFLSPALAGNNWDVLLNALATGDDTVQTLATRMYSQLFVPTASGKYLDVQGANRGLPRPAGIGISDELYRQLIVSVTNQKLTLNAVLRLLEITYGPHSTRAWTEATVTEPYSLTTGDSLKILVDETDAIEVVFKTSDFQNISAATAAEIAAKITKTFRQENSDAFALSAADPVTGNTSVHVFSGKIGLGGSVRIMGGRAQEILRFPTAIATTQDTGTTWVIAVGNSGRVRFTKTSGTDPSLFLVQLGDYVSLVGGVWNVANRGSFVIKEVTGTYFEVSIEGWVGGTVPLVAASDMSFWRPTKYTVYSSRHIATAAQPAVNHLVVRLAATTQIVQRGIDLAGYLQLGKTQAASMLTRTPDGIATVTTVDLNSGLSVGDYIFIDGMYSDPQASIEGFQATNGSMAAARTYAASIVLSDGRVLVTGGLVSASPVATCTIYDPATGMWSAAASMHSARSRHAIIALLSAGNKGKILVAGGGTSEVYDPSTDTWVVTGAMVRTRSDFAMFNGFVASVPATAVIAVGGDTTTTATEYFDEGLGTWTAYSKLVLYDTVKAMSVTRIGTDRSRVLIAGGDNGTVKTNKYMIWVIPTEESQIISSNTMPASFSGHAAVWVPKVAPGGAVLVAGGNNGAADLSTSYVYNVAKNAWTSTGALVDIQTDSRLVLLTGTTVLLVGGGSTKKSLVYDSIKGTWVAPAVTTSTNRKGGDVLALNDGTFLALGGTTNSEIFTLVSAQGSGRTNGFFRVTDTGTSSQASFQTDLDEATVVTGDDSSIVTSYAALPGVGAAHIFGLGSPSVTGVETVIAQDLVQGNSYRSITVADTTGFNPNGGWIVFNFGHEVSVGPMQYLAAPDATHLVLDQSFIFPSDIDTDSTITSVVDRSPFVPVEPEQYGTLYLTASPAGRVATSNLIDAITALGINITKTVIYPGDAGLGGHGYPDADAQKLADRVWIWGGDDPTAELEAARSA